MLTTARFLLQSSNRLGVLAKPNTSLLRSMGNIAEGVEFDTIAREWRCKVSRRSISSKAESNL